MNTPDLFNQEQIELTAEQKEAKTILFRTPALGITRQPMSVFTPVFQHSVIALTPEIIAKYGLAGKAEPGEPLINSALSVEKTKIFLEIFAPQPQESAEMKSLHYAQIFDYAQSIDPDALARAITPMLDKAARSTSDHRHLSTVVLGSKWSVAYRSKDKEKKQTELIIATSQDVLGRGGNDLGAKLNALSKHINKLFPVQIYTPLPLLSMGDKQAAIYVIRQVAQYMTSDLQIFIDSPAYGQLLRYLIPIIVEKKINISNAMYRLASEEARYRHLLSQGEYPIGADIREQLFVIPLSEMSKVLRWNNDQKKSNQTRNDAEAHQLLLYFAGAYIDELDLSRSVITGSAIPACIGRTVNDGRGEWFIDKYYPAYGLSADNMDEKSDGIAAKGKYEGWLNDIAKLPYSALSDVDISVQATGNEYNAIVADHIRKIKRWNPNYYVTKREGLVEYTYTLHDRYKMNRKVEIYAAPLRDIMLHHVAPARGWYGYNPETKKNGFFGMASMYWTNESNTIGDVSYIESNTNPFSILAKYANRGYEIRGENSWRILDTVFPGLTPGYLFRRIGIGHNFIADVDYRDIQEVQEDRYGGRQREEEEEEEEEGEERKTDMSPSKAAAADARNKKISDAMLKYKDDNDGFYSILEENEIIPDQDAKEDAKVGGVVMRETTMIGGNRGEQGQSSHEDEWKEKRRFPSKRENKSPPPVSVSRGMPVLQQQMMGFVPQQIYQQPYQQLQPQFQQPYQPQQTYQPQQPYQQLQPQQQPVMFTPQPYQIQQQTYPTGNNNFPQQQTSRTPSPVRSPVRTPSPVRSRSPSPVRQQPQPNVMEELDQLLSSLGVESPSSSSSAASSNSYRSPSSSSGSYQSRSSPSSPQYSSPPLLSWVNNYSSSSSSSSGSSSSSWTRY